MSAPVDQQLVASDPRASAAVEANAGSGKTYTLVTRVARLLLSGVKPEAILCVTYTKAAAAEMQTRLFSRLGEWAVARDEDLEKALRDIDEEGRDLSAARALFARALETPGGLKIQTLHAFCEQVLRRFPIEAGVRPGFEVADDTQARALAAGAAAELNDFALAYPDSELAEAYAHLSTECDFGTFGKLLDDIQNRRGDLTAFFQSAGTFYPRYVWGRLGFEHPSSPEQETENALLRIRWGEWNRRGVEMAKTGAKSAANIGVQMEAAGSGMSFPEAFAILFTQAGAPRSLERMGLDSALKSWLQGEQDRLAEMAMRISAARMARNTVHVLTLARAYIGLYQNEKARRGLLDFSDLTVLTRGLLLDEAAAPWVLYKLDGGIEHVLLDEAQDTAPDQWDIARALVEEFYSGAGAKPGIRTVFTVGDPKQSIYSFQGAEPARLAVETAAFRERAFEAQHRFQTVQLNQSWRSTPEILSFVDAVFAEPELSQGLRPGRGESVTPYPIRHEPRRDAGGCVELWPREEGVEGEEPDAWEPVDAEPAQSANKRLATRIAAAVVSMVKGGETVIDKNTRQPRPIRFGDVLILVRRRNVLFDEIIRALKQAGAPIAGADRLKLTEHGLFDDLLALGRFAAFSWDDLTLAALLRSPAADLSEQDLYDLAQPRAGSLWGALVAGADERPRWRAAASFLGWLIEEAKRAAPFDLYSRALARLDPDGLSLRQRVLTRLGGEAEEAMDAFLAQALCAEQRGTRDLETFLAEMAQSELVIKREQETAEGGEDAGEVRVMTVHGAKGLEAPVVILPDTTTKASPQGTALLACDDGGFLWAPRSKEDSPASAEARQVRDQACAEESARLLYVALTRARDRLIVCGVKGKRDSLFEGSWYQHVERAFGELDTHPFVLPLGGEGLRYGTAPAAVARTAEAPAPIFPLPAWARGLAPAEPTVARYASPSTSLEESSAPAPSPLANERGLGRFRRGDIIHRLLQLLPDIPAARREAFAARILRRERDLTDEQRAEMQSAALRVLEDERFAAVFGPGSRPEVAVAGVSPRLPPGLTVSGRVDRLLVEPGRVLVADFKTNRPAPARIEDADPAYIRQMALYVTVLEAVFPECTVEAALVWTDGPRLMPVPAVLIDAAMSRLAADAQAPTSTPSPGA